MSNIEYLLVINPVVLLVIFILYKREKRKRNNEILLFGKEIKNTTRTLLINISLGILMGVICSFLIKSFNIKIDIYILYIYLISIVLSRANRRFLCISYGGGILAIIYTLMGNINEAIYILKLIGILHFIEGILIYLDSYRNRNPIYLEERGRIKAGYWFDSLWMVPIISIVDRYVILLPLILGYKNLISSGDTKKRTKKSSINSIIYGVSIIFLLFFIHDNWMSLILLSLYSIILHEIIIKVNTNNWNDDKYLYCKQGVRVLDVLDENSLLEPLDTIIEINGHRIYTIKDIKKVLSKDGKYHSIKYIDYNSKLKLFYADTTRLNVIPLIDDPDIVVQYIFNINKDLDVYKNNVSLNDK